MHTYPSYIAPSGEAIVEFVRANPFAIVATSTAGAPVATHVPIVFQPGFEPQGTFVGETLWGHMGRDNPHWQLFAENPSTLLAFSTSHAYVSPSNYGFADAVPTLDYATVHLTGKVTIIEDDALSLDVVKQTVSHFESARSEPWEQSPSFPIYEKILPGIVAFTIEVETESAMFKLSQDMPADVHERVVADLTSGERKHPDVAALMRRIGVSAEAGQTDQPGI
ncbi:FMN-binding negative transcriptional regulator [Leucobacter sp. UCMA 4100]|uniref:FMN-binding negative transcriptional regulator n=1 Tax=Leucobacter sp. UCMA 4100 TaxID=2810534 RepID=UPI0022EB593C|nr:FMN-binding negative transcriptional regulator [Leucobacter sp. UCMA 4100]MDA3146931.1 FMN-binding negative transcriptional regulator [Leucobacter sp. UCMA 4100]